MICLAVAGVIYGLGIMFVVCLAMMEIAGILAEGEFSIKKITKFPILAVFVITGYALAWPLMLSKDPGFREIVIECGRFAIPFGYLAAVLGTFAYPWIWAWFVSSLIAWMLLERYHRKTLTEVKNV